MAQIKLIDIKGLGSNYCEKLKSARIVSSFSLLKNCNTPEKRKYLSEKTEISTSLLLRWANKIDLLRLEGIGVDFWKLFEFAKVNSLEELTRINADELFKVIQTINDEKQIVKRNLSLWEVKNWINQAKIIPKVILGSNETRLEKRNFIDLEKHIEEEDHLEHYLHRLRQSRPLRTTLIPEKSFQRRDLNQIYEKIRLKRILK